MNARLRDADFDGNLLGGPLSDVFTQEATTAQARCLGCGLLSAMAELAVYGPEPGLVARCPGCASVVLRLVRASGAVWLDLSGMSMLRMQLLPENA
jgi:hypothetical protein